MRICIDSNQFVFGISGTNASSEELLALLPHLDVVVPRLILREVTCNLTKAQIRSLYALLKKARVTIVEEPVPADLVKKYVGLGLREKADALIGAFAEWQSITYLISANRHFLNELRSDAFEVLRSDEFLRRYRRSIIQAEE